MNSVMVCVIATGVDADTALDRVRDFAQYPHLAEAVISVEVDESADLTMLSTWTVRFRRGLMRWTERDFVDLENRIIAFEQVSGDFTKFDGSWHISDTDRGAKVEFAAQFDLGIPSLNELLNPLAETALRANVISILTGLFGRIEHVAPADTAEKP